MFEIRKLIAEGVCTGLLVFFAVGVATLSFGFDVTGTSDAAGVVATALAFGLVVLVLSYAFSSISGAHFNPAVTLGCLLARRIDLRHAIGYWLAQFAGALVGAGFLRAIFGVARGCSTGTTGLGTNGYNSRSIIAAESAAQGPDLHVPDPHGQRLPRTGAIQRRPVTAVTP